MDRKSLLLKLNEILLEELPQFSSQVATFQPDSWERFHILVNLRPAAAATETFLNLQDQLLKLEVSRKGVTHFRDLTPVEPNIYLWQGDISTLDVDSIVNAANGALQGCFVPLHKCIDNIIHTYAGVQLRLECAKIIEQQGYPETVGKAKLTSAYNLPCRYVIHTVGPFISSTPTSEECDLLASSYRSCLELATENSIHSIAFCCISTGVFNFPNDLAAEIAIDTVRKFLKAESKIDVIFNVFKEIDLQIYRKLLDLS